MSYIKAGIALAALFTVAAVAGKKKKKKQISPAEQQADQQAETAAPQPSLPDSFAPTEPAPGLTSQPQNAYQTAESDYRSPEDCLNLEKLSASHAVINPLSAEVQRAPDRKRYDLVLHGSYQGRAPSNYNFFTCMSDIGDVDEFVFWGELKPGLPSITSLHKNAITVILHNAYGRVGPKVSDKASVLGLNGQKVDVKMPPPRLNVRLS